MTKLTRDELKALTKEAIRELLLEFGTGKNNIDEPPAPSPVQPVTSEPQPQRAAQHAVPTSAPDVPEKRKLLRLEQAAAVLGWHVVTARNKARAGLLPGARRIGGRWFVAVSKFERHLGYEPGTLPSP